MLYNQKKHTRMMLSSGGMAAFITILISGSLLIPTGTKYDFELSFILIYSVITLLLFTGCFFFFSRKYRRRNKLIHQPVPGEWEKILSTKVTYYSTLTEDEKKRFISQVQIFLDEKEIIPIETDLDEECKVLIAASALIPVFGYPDWEYDNLTEVLVYPDNFNLNYDFKAEDKNILGLVTGRGSTMILSKPSLYHGFEQDNDKLNVGFHEFAHKIDGQDGYIDGVPAMFADSRTIRQWLEIIKKESDLIRKGKSDINPYALTNNAEFFAVVSEYFFENPDSMSTKHPQLYTILKKMFKQDTKSRFAHIVKSMFIPYGKKLGRNSPCPCGSGKKYKHCCLKKKQR